MMNPDDIINTKPKEEPKPEPEVAEEEATAEEPVKRKKRKKHFFDRFDITSIVEYDTIAANLPYVIFIAFLMLVYIWNSHFAQRSINSIGKNEKQLQELKWQYIYSKSDLECKSQQSQVAKMMRTAGTGVKELKEPPVKIYLTTDGKN